jgi:antitoxin component HigA of HigAB toxin-antitoxin module
MTLPIKTPQAYEVALARIDQLICAPRDTQAAVELAALAVQLERYERATFPMEPPTPAETAEFRAENMEHPKARISEEMEKRRRLVEYGEAHNRIEGLEPNPDVQYIFDAYLAGDIELGDITDRLDDHFGHKR